MEDLKENILEESLEETTEKNDFEILYIDEITLEKRKEAKSAEKKAAKNKKINIVLDIFIVIAVIGIIIAIINLAFPERIAKITDPIKAYFINKEIEKEAKAGNLIPASMMEPDENEIEEITEETDTATIELETKNEPMEVSKPTATSFEINDETIHNFNEKVIILKPDEAYVQSSNENKILMLNSEKMYEIGLNCMTYRIQDNNGKYYLIINSELSNLNYPDEITLGGIITANIENEIITSNKSNIPIGVGETGNVDIYFSLTEVQYKLIKNEIDSITFIYRDNYNYREIFATYGGNFEE